MLCDQKCFAIIEELGMSSVAQDDIHTVPLSSIRSELRSLIHGSGFCRIDRALFTVTGKDRVRWLNGMVSNNIRDLAPGHGVYAFVLNAQGQIQGDLYAFNRGESLVLEINRAQSDSLLTLLRRYIIMDKVEIQETPDLIPVGVTGPESTGALEASGIVVPDLKPLELLGMHWNGTDIALVRTDNPEVQGYELWTPSERVDSLFQTLNSAGAAEIHALTVEEFRILSGIPKFGQDIRERTLPQETGQERALNFTKGCYIGQEIVERIRARGSVHRMFTGFELEAAPPAPGTKIQSEGKDVGEITSVASVPLREGRFLALGYLRREFAAPEKELSAEGRKLKIRSLPFAELHSD